MDEKHIWWVRKTCHQWELKFHFLGMTGYSTLGWGQLTCIDSFLGLE